MYEGNAKGFIHFIIINSTKHRLNERSNTIQEWPLSDHIVRKWYNGEDALEPRREKWDFCDEGRERGGVRKGTNCLEIGVRSTS